MEMLRWAASDGAGVGWSCSWAGLDVWGDEGNNRIWMLVDEG